MPNPEDVEPNMVVYAKGDDGQPTGEPLWSGSLFGANRYAKSIGGIAMTAAQSDALLAARG